MVEACSAIAACIACIIAWTLWPSRLPTQQPIANSQSPVAASDTYRFTSDELQRTRRLVCELDSVFENQLQLIHMHNQQLEFNISNRPVSDSSSSRVVLRFVLQQRNEDGNWTTVQSEEVIGGKDHQFKISESKGMTVQYWSHLLPDDSLWAEIDVSTDATESKVSATSQSRELRCVANQPAVVWNQDLAGRDTRLLVIYMNY
ncbi:MAG: hypothetical protein R3C05_11970 [Pirellulaceae bacterium]